MACRSRKRNYLSPSPERRLHEIDPTKFPWSGNSCGNPVRESGDTKWNHRTWLTVARRFVTSTATCTTRRETADPQTNYFVLTARNHSPPGPVDINIDDWTDHPSLLALHVSDCSVRRKTAKFIKCHWRNIRAEPSSDLSLLAKTIRWFFENGKYYLRMDFTRENILPAIIILRNFNLSDILVMQLSLHKPIKK